MPSTLIRWPRVWPRRSGRYPQIRITRKVEANGVFAIVPRECLPILLKEYFFYVWNEATSEVRWMTSFDTMEEDIEKFVGLLRETVR